MRFILRLQKLYASGWGNISKGKGRAHVYKSKSLRNIAAVHELWLVENALNKE